MGTVCQLLALPACFLLVGLLGGDGRSFVLSFLRRVGNLMGADEAARVELLQRFSPPVPSGFAGSVQRRREARAAAKARTKRAAGTAESGARPTAAASAAPKRRLVSGARWFIVLAARPHGAPLHASPR